LLFGRRSNLPTFHRAHPSALGTNPQRLRETPDTVDLAGRRTGGWPLTWDSRQRTRGPWSPRGSGRLSYGTIQRGVLGQAEQPRASCGVFKCFQVPRRACRCLRRRVLPGAFSCLRVPWRACRRLRRRVLPGAFGCLRVPWSACRCPVWIAKSSLDQSACGRFWPLGSFSYTHRPHCKLARAPGGQNPRGRFLPHRFVWRKPKIDCHHTNRPRPRHVDSCNCQVRENTIGSTGSPEMADLPTLHVWRPTLYLRLPYTRPTLHLRLPYTCAYPTLAPTLYTDLPCTSSPTYPAPRRRPCTSSPTYPAPRRRPCTCAYPTHQPTCTHTRPTATSIGKGDARKR